MKETTPREITAAPIPYAFGNECDGIHGPGPNCHFQYRPASADGKRTSAGEPIASPGLALPDSPVQA